MTYPAVKPIDWAIPENIRTAHTTDGFSEFQGQGGVLRTGNPTAWGDTYEWNSEGMGGLDLGFTQETDKNVFLESAFLWTF